MGVEDSKGAGPANRKPRAPSKLPIRLFGSPNPRDKRHIRNDFISSTPLNALKKKLIEVDQLGLSPIRNPSSISTTTESSPAKLNRIDDEVLPQNKVTKTDEKQTLTTTVTTKSVASFYPFPLSRLQIKNMVLYESDDSSRQSKKSIEKNKYEKISGVTNINSVESTERNEVNNVKSIQTQNEDNCSDIFLTESDKELVNNKNKLEKDLINNKRKHSTPNKNTKENKIEDNIFNGEIKNNDIEVHETIVSHNSKRARPKKSISVNKSIEKNRTKQFSQKQNNFKRRGRPPKVSTTNDINDGTLSTKVSDKTVQFSQNNITETQNSKLNLRSRSVRIKTSNELSDGTTNLTEESSKRIPIKNIPFKNVNKKVSNRNNNTKMGTKLIENENSLRKSSRKRISCVKYWLANNEKNETTQKEQEISKLKNKQSKNAVTETFAVPLPPQKKSRKKPSKPIDNSQEISSTNKIDKTEESIVTKKPKYGRSYKTFEKTISQENNDVSEKMNEISDKKLSTSKTEIPSINKILKTPEKPQTIQNIVEQSQLIQQPKTPEQNNAIDKLITLSTKKSSVKQANKCRVLTSGKIRRSLAFKNRSSIKKTPTDDSYTTEEENGIPTDTLLVNKEEPEEYEKIYESRKRKKSSVDTFDTKKVKISNTKYSFKNLALEADISPFRAGGLADVQINGKRCLLGCFGKFPRQFNTNVANPDISVGISLNNPYIATGMIELNPDGKKKYEYAKKADLLLIVLEGMAEVGIGNSSQVLRMGQDFFVPRDTPYYIINLSRTDKLLLYFSKYLNK